MRKVLKNLHKRLKKKEIKSDIIKVLISIITDIAYENPRTYPHTSAILSKLLYSIEKEDERANTIDLIVNKFSDLPNTGLMEIWIQRITLLMKRDKEYKEPLCRKVYDSDIVLWNSDWLNGRLKNIINSTPIINEEILEKLNPVIEVREIDLFGDRY